jgi:hypothetical protein
MQNKESKPINNQKGRSTIGHISWLPAETEYMEPAETEYMATDPTTIPAAEPCVLEQTKT